VSVAAVNRFFERCETLSKRVTATTVAAASNPLEVWQRRRLPKRLFDPDEDRFPIGNTIALTMLLVVAAAIWVLI
jgi:hypothetical protein